MFRFDTFTTHECSMIMFSVVSVCNAQTFESYDLWSSLLICQHIFRISRSSWLSGGKDGILSELLHAGLCDTMFTVSSTLMWAVLTGPADWVCHIGALTPCIEAVAQSCIIVTWWSGAGGIQASSERPTGFLQCFDAHGLVIWPVKIVPEMTYHVFGGTLNLAESYLGQARISGSSGQGHRSKNRVCIMRIFNSPSKHGRRQTIGSINQIKQL